ncbi:MAG: FAD-dependent oxidoreductase [Deltaproteobacteria bacterium]|nr:FAD-dependent oxidoreductase [Deltaproteobacteria bacterium]
MSEQDSQRAGRTTRRSFLKALGSAAGLAALPIGTSRAEVPSARGGDDYDVVVIGAGFAGVAAARELGNAGLRTVVLEARNRIGGRTFTAELDGRHYDLGGMWVHWCQPHVWAEISRYGLALAETPGAVPDRIFWWSEGELQTAGILDVLSTVGEAFCAKGSTAGMEFDALAGSALLAGLMADFHEGAATAFPLPMDPFASIAEWSKLDDLSVRDRLDRMELSTSHRALLEGVFGASCCGAFSDCAFVEMLRWWALSGQDFQRFNDYSARYKIEGGTVRLLSAMLADAKADLLLGTPVRRVEQDESGVRVFTDTGRRFTAGAVVAALPMNVLANVEFAPALDPVKVAASKQRHGGFGVKVYARLRGEIPRFVAFAGENEPLSMMFTAEAGSAGGTVIAFGTNPNAIDVHDAKALEPIVRRYLPHVTVTDTLAYDWTLDPYSVGTWCILRPGQMSGALAKLREPAGRVHFAGSDFALGFRGFIDGAIESGVRTAQEVAALLNGRAGSRRAAGRAAAGPAAAPPGVDAAASSAAPPPASQICKACHPTDANAGALAGPNLHGVVGRDIASAPGFAYSPSLAGKPGAWTPQQLEAFLRDPATFAPGTRMAFGGLRDAEERAAVVEWLAGLR